MFPGWDGGVGWLETDNNRAISVHLNLTGTATGTELGKKYLGDRGKQQAFFIRVGFFAGSISG